MNLIQHHPTELTLVDYGNGRLDAGRHLVVQAHVERCDICRQYLNVMDQVGGALLRDAEPVALEKDAFSKTLAKIKPEADDEDGRPVRAELGSWRWLGPRIQWRAVKVPHADGTRVFMLRAKGNTWLPQHRHSDLEWTCVLEGAFSHEGGRYGPGDFDEADDAITHHPFVEAGPSCVCLVALRGEVRFDSWVGRLIQPFIKL